MRRNHQHGQSVIEFALVLPLLLIILLGTIEFALCLYDKAVITNASREGARHGIISQDPRVTDAEIMAVVNNYCSTHLVTFSTNSPITTITRPGSGPYTYTDELTVNVTYNYGWLVMPGFIGVPDPLALSATTVMRFE